MGPFRKAGRLGKLVPLITAGLVAACTQPAPSTHGWAVVAHITVGKNAGPVRLGGQWAFVPNMGDGTVTQVDRTSGKVAATIPVSDPRAVLDQGCAPDSVHAYYSGSWGWRACNTPYAIAWDGSSLWALDNGRMQLVLVDPVSHRATDHIDLPGTGWDLAISGTTAWVSGNDANRSLYKVDLRARRVVAAVSDLDQGSAALAANSNGVWVVCARGETGHLDHVDPASGNVVGRYPIEWWSTAVVANGGAVYVRGTNGGDISRLDSATGALVWTQPGPGFIGNFGLDQLGMAADGIWLSGPTTMRVDLASGKVAETIRLASNSAAAGNNELWLVLLDGSVVKLQTK